MGLLDHQPFVGGPFGQSVSGGLETVDQLTALHRGCADRDRHQGVDRDKGQQHRHLRPGIAMGAVRPMDQHQRSLIRQRESGRHQGNDHDPCCRTRQAPADGQQDQGRRHQKHQGIAGLGEDQGGNENHETQFRQQLQMAAPSLSGPGPHLAWGPGVPPRINATSEATLVVLVLRRMLERNTSTVL